MYRDAQPVAAMSIEDFLTAGILAAEAVARKPKLLAHDHKSVVTFECYWHVAIRMPLMWVRRAALVTPQKVRLGRSSFGAAARLRGLSVAGFVEALVARALAEAEAQKSAAGG